MDRDSIKERCLANMWLFFSEDLALEALHNILTQTPMSWSFCEAAKRSPTVNAGK
jgi:hypothetical protein